MHHVIGTLVIGAFAGGAAGRRLSLRPALRGLVKSGIVAKRKLEAASNTAMGEMHKLVEEARADLDRTGTEQPS